MRRSLAVALGISCLASLGNGAGGVPTVSLGTARPAVAGAYAYLVEAGDFDGDGISDAVAVTYNEANVILARGTGSGTFDPGQSYALAPGGITSRLVRSSDLNGDGALDLVVSRLSVAAVRSTDVLLSDGAGGFALTTYAGDFTDLSDWDGDGDPDLVSVPSSSSFGFRANDGTGMFGAATTITVHDTQPSQLGPCAAADIDGDGDADIVSVAATSYLEVYFRRADGTLDAGVRLPRPAGAVTTLAYLPPLLRDFDGDGLIDAAATDAVTTAKGAWLVYRRSGPTTFLPADTYAIGTISDTWETEAADLNGDGRPELLTPNDVLVNLGDGTFAPALPFNGAYATSYNRLPFGAGVAVADVDGDGTPDILQLEFGRFGHGTGWIPVTLDAAPQPTISAFSRPTLFLGSSVEVELTGTGFQTGAALDFGAGITQTWVRYDSANSVTANVAVSADAPTGPRAVRLVNPDGGTATASIEVASSAPPATITSVVPDRAHIGDSVEVTVRGTGFTEGLGVSLGTVVTVDSVTRVDETTVTFQATLPIVWAGVPESTRTLTLTNGTGVVSVPDAFTILPVRSIDVSAQRGRLRVASRPGRSRISVSGVLRFNEYSQDGTFDPQTEAAELRFGPKDAPVVVSIPADDRWVLRGRKAKWRSPAGARPSIVLRLDFGKGTYRLDATRTDIRRPAADDVLVEMTLGGETGTSVRSWRRNRAGSVLNLK